MSRDDALVKMTVNLTSKAHVAMEETAARLGDTGADTVNRALVLYAAIAVAACDESGRGRVQFDLFPDAPVVLQVQREIAPSA